MATYKIQYRRSTAAIAAASNPVLAVGEPGMETDTGKTKLGDGVTTWNALPYDAPNATVLSATSARPRASFIAFIGDSITSIGQFDMTKTSSHGYAPQAIVFAKHRLTNVNRDAANMYFATGGWTLAQIAGAGYHTAAAASPAGIVVVHAGTNDLGNSQTAAFCFAGLKTVWGVLLAAGKTVVATTILPRNLAGDAAAGITAEMHELNNLIRQYANATPGLVLCDWADVNLDPATGKLHANYASDGVHPNTAGATRLGAYLGNVLLGLTVAATVPAVMPTVGARGMTPNPFAIGDVAGLATSWTTLTLGAPTSVTRSKVPRTDGVAGEWQQAVVVGGTKNDGVRFSSSKTGGFAAGDQVVGVVEFETDAAGWAGWATVVSLWVDGPNLSPADLWNDDNAANLAPSARFPSGFLATPVLTLPASPATTGVDVNFAFFGTGTIRVSRMQVVKVN